MNNHPGMVAVDRTGRINIAPSLHHSMSFQYYMLNCSMLNAQQVCRLVIRFFCECAMNRLDYISVSLNLKV